LDGGTPPVVHLALAVLAVAFLVWVTYMVIRYAVLHALRDHAEHQRILATRSGPLPTKVVRTQTPATGPRPSP